MVPGWPGEEKVTDLDLWEVRTVHGGLRLELRGGDSGDGMRTKPATVIVKGGEQVRVELAVADG